MSNIEIDTPELQLIEDPQPTNEERIRLLYELIQIKLEKVISNRRSKS